MGINPLNANSVAARGRPVSMEDSALNAKSARKNKVN